MLSGSKTENKEMRRWGQKENIGQSFAEELHRDLSRDFYPLFAKTTDITGFGSVAEPAFY